MAAASACACHVHSLVRRVVTGPMRHLMARDETGDGAFMRWLCLGLMSGQLQQMASPNYKIELHGCRVSAVLCHGSVWKCLELLTDALTWNFSSVILQA